MVVARCWQQWITEGRVYRRGGHPVPSRETIRRRLAEVEHEEPTSAKTVTTAPHHRHLSADDHRHTCLERTGQRSDPAFIVEWHTAISQGVTVWGAISWDTRSSLVVLQGTLTARRYVDDILTPIVLPMLSSHLLVPFINRIMLVHILRDSPNNVFKDMTSYHGLPVRSFANRACLDALGGNCSRPEIQEN
ncbi:HTH_Tnp_Tc3_2 domain-containing protein [Trichonephila clavipes]|nr:HTH_Tnp_Tc3_2 domain-containing protein [Trichonephila clavipes]